MSLKLYSAVHFDKGMPQDKNGNISNEYDWVNSTVNGIGEQTVSLFCQAKPGRKVEDFYEYFSQNEIIWYKFILSRSAKILKILRVHTYDIEDVVLKFELKPFPAYEYKFQAHVADVDQTDNNLYKTNTAFSISY